jgi:parallel beta helix pectate lyase-like protein
MARSTGSTKISALALGLLLAPAAAWAQNASAPGAIELYPNYNAVGVRLAYTGDANANATARVEWRPQGASTWTTGVNMTRITGNRWAGSVLWLAEDTPYDVRVTISDPDGGGTASGATRTRKTPAPTVTGRTWWVATNGSDANSGTSAAPLATLQAAGNQAQPGDEIRVRPGIYYQTFGTPRSGTASAWIQLVADAPGVILDGADPAYLSRSDWQSEGGGIYSIAYAPASNRLVLADSTQRLYKQADLASLQVNANSVTQGFAVQNGRLYVKLEDGSSPAGHRMSIARYNIGVDIDNAYWRVSGLEIRHFGNGPGGCGMQLGGANNCWITDNYIQSNGGRGMYCRLLASGNLIERNQVRDFRIFTWPWAATKAHDEETCGIANRAGRGNVIRHNLVQGIFDGIDVGDGSADENVGADCDMHDNQILQVRDDAFETDDASAINLRVYHNRIDDVFNGVSMAPIYQGPEYVLYNTITNYWRSGFKFSLSGVGVGWICHNTVTSSYSPSAAVHPSGPYSNLHFRNNILTGNNLYCVDDDAGESDVGNDFDADVLYVNAGTLFHWKGAYYNTLAAVQSATGFEMNGRQGDPLFNNAGAGDYSLRVGSPAIDLGLRLPGINDLFSGAAPDAGSLEFAGSGPDVIPPAAVRDLN